MKEIPLTNMRLNPEKIDWASGATPTGPAGAAPAYPYGLTVTLNNESLEKLGLTGKMPPTSTELVLLGKVLVTAVTDEPGETDSATRNRSVTLQITDMGLAAEAKGPTAESVLYDGPQSPGD